jgi:hypothetical protein
MQMTVVAILYALGCPTCEPVLMAVCTTDAGPSICQSTADAMNVQAEQATDPRFYCDE